MFLTATDGFAYAFVRDDFSNQHSWIYAPDRVSFASHTDPRFVEYWGWWHTREGLQVSVLPDDVLRAEREREEPSVPIPSPRRPAHVLDTDIIEARRTFTNTWHTVESASLGNVDWAVPPRMSLREDIVVENQMARTNLYPIEQVFAKVGEAVGRSSFSKDKTDVAVGLEFENETEATFNLPEPSGWRFHTEGSLRNFGFEYVSKKPVTIPKTKKLVSNLFEALNKSAAAGNQKLLNSLRTSTHVHFDVTQYNYLDIVNFASVYWILEDLLTHFCGDSRKGNLFCLRLKDAMLVQQRLITALTSSRPARWEIATETFRYNSVNFAAIPKFGSLEFRLMRGVDNSEEAMQWLEILNNIRLFALKYPDPRALHKAFIKDFDAEDFPEAVIGRESYRLVENKFPKGFNNVTVRDTVREGFMQVSNLLTAVKDWSYTDALKQESIVKEAEAKKYEEAKKRAAKAQAAEEARIEEVLRLRREERQTTAQGNQTIAQAAAEPPSRRRRNDLPPRTFETMRHWYAARTMPREGDLIITNAIGRSNRYINGRWETFTAIDLEETV